MDNKYERLENNNTLIVSKKLTLLKCLLLQCPNLHSVFGKLFHNIIAKYNKMLSIQVPVDFIAVEKGD